MSDEKKILLEAIWQSVCDGKLDRRVLPYVVDVQHVAATSELSEALRMLKTLETSILIPVQTWAANIQRVWAAAL